MHSVAPCLKMSHLTVLATSKLELCRISPAILWVCYLTADRSSSPSLNYHRDQTLICSTPNQHSQPGSQSAATINMPCQTWHVCCSSLVYIVSSGHIQQSAECCSRLFTLPPAACTDPCRKNVKAASATCLFLLQRSPRTYKAIGLVRGT